MVEDTHTSYVDEYNSSQKYSFINFSKKVIDDLNSNIDLDLGLKINFSLKMKGYSITKKDKSRFKVKYEVSGESFFTKPNKTTFMIQNTIKKVTGYKPKLSTSGGTSDARFIKNISPCLEFGLVGKTMHKIDESVSVSDLKKLTKIYENILVSYFK